MSLLNANPTIKRGKRTRTSKVDYKRLAGEEDSDEDTSTNPLYERAGTKIYESSDRPTQYGNKHTQTVVNNLFDDVSSILQVVSDGSALTAEALYKGEMFNINKPILVVDTPESLGMTIPKKLTVRNIAQCIGFSFPINVMDVSTQEELPDWTMKDLVLYFECPVRKERLANYIRNIGSNTCENSKASRDNLPKILNQISLEFSKTPLVRRVQSPSFVRDIDWIDNAWPKNRKNINEYPQVQYYCLTSTTGCYTDFHIDFGGTSVWYHVLSGEKIFLLIPPTKENLHFYEEWICNPKQGDIFFANLADKCYKVKLEAGKTLIIPTGWIHAVYTPIDSIVIGGNFLHSLNIKGQLDVHCIEARTHVPQKFRFPFFTQMNFYASSMLLKKLRKGKLYEIELKGLPSLIEALKLWNVAPGGDAETHGSISQLAAHAAHLANCSSAIEMIKELESRLERINIGEERNSLSTDRCIPKLKLFRKSLKIERKVDEDNSAAKQNLEVRAHSKFQIFVPKEPVFSMRTDNKVPKHKSVDLSYVDAKPSLDEEWKPNSKKQKNKKLKISQSSIKNKKIMINKVQLKKLENPEHIDVNKQENDSNSVKKKQNQGPFNSQARTSKANTKSSSLKGTLKRPLTTNNKKGAVRDRLLKRFRR